jgi:hypothetical protein
MKDHGPNDTARRVTYAEDERLRKALATARVIEVRAMAWRDEALLDHAAKTVAALANLIERVHQ